MSLDLIYLTQRSTTRQALLKTLEENGYDSLELLLTPLQYGIPNSRLRYYLLAKARPKQFSGILNRHGNQVWRHIPNDTGPKSDSDYGCPVTEIRRYLDRDSQTACFESLQIPDRVLERWGRLFDIVLPSSQRTCCFTRGELIRSPGTITAIESTPRLHPACGTRRLDSADK